jgi:hypothetical protein
MGANAYQIGLDQLAALRYRQGVLVHRIRAAAAWIRAATERNRSATVLFEVDAKFYELLAELQGGPRPSSKALVLPTEWEICAERLAHWDSAIDNVNLHWQLRTSTDEEPVAQIADELASARREQRQHSFAGAYLEGLSLMASLNAAIKAWEDHVADVPQFLSNAGISTDGLEDYLAVMRSVCASSAGGVREVYVGVVDDTYRPVLYAWSVDHAVDAEAVHHGERDALCNWMNALADGGINVSEREVVLRALPAEFDEAAAAAWEFTADRP